MKKLVIILTFFCCFLPVFSQGLQFYGNEKNIDERSTLTIPAGEDEAKNVEVYELNFSLKNQCL